MGTVRFDREETARQSRAGTSLVGWSRPVGGGRRAVGRVTVALSLLLVACGTRLPEADIAAASGAGGGPVAGLSDDAPGGSEAEVAAGGATAGGDASDVPGVSAGTDASGAASATSAGPQEGGGEDAAGSSGREDASSRDGDGDGGSGAPVVIGNVGTYSGVMGTVLEPGRIMAQVWAAHVNGAGGLGGHPVELITADDRGDPSRAQALVRQMVEEDGAIAFVGNLTPYSASSYATYLESRGVPAVGGDNWQRAWYENPLMFPHSTHIPSLLAVRSHLNVRQGSRRLGVVFCAEAEVCRDFENAFAPAAKRGGGQPVFKAEASLAQPNFTAECLSARNSDVEALMMAMPADAIQRIMRDCAAQNFRPAYSACAICIPQPDSFADDPNAEGFVVESAVFPWTSTQAAAGEFAKAAATHAPGLQMSGATAQVWAAGALLEAAVEHVNPEGSLTAADVVRGLHALPDGFTVGGLTVPLTFVEGGPHRIADCAFWATVEDGTWVAPDGLEPACV